MRSIKLFAVILSVVLVFSACGIVSESDQPNATVPESLENGERFTQFCRTEDDDICVLTDAGNVYHYGNLTEKYNYGVQDVNDSLFSGTYGKGRMPVYLSGDARKINVNLYGGTIITKTNDVYVFLNAYPDDHPKFKTPAYLCSGYTDASVEMGNFSKVYALSENGDFGWFTIQEPDDFHVLANNVKKFKSAIEINYVLTTDNKLYLIRDDQKVTPQREYIGNVLDFDFYNNDLSGTMLSILDDKHEVYTSFGDNPKKPFVDGLREGMIKTGKDKEVVIAFSGGVAMLDSKGNLSLSCIQNSSESNVDVRQVENALSNVKTVSAYLQNLYIINVDDTWQTVNAENLIKTAE